MMLLYASVYDALGGLIAPGSVSSRWVVARGGGSGEAVVPVGRVDPRDVVSVRGSWADSAAVADRPPRRAEARSSF
jgi:hypothetical protein